jgi:hypothetical protein
MKTQPLKKIKPGRGFLYMARTNHPELSSHRRPSLAILLEDNKPLIGPSNALHDEIRQLGKGRYSFWHSDVFFSTSDNSDPRTNGRTYSFQYAESEWSRFSLLLVPLQSFLRILYHPLLPYPIRQFFLESGYFFDAVRRLGLTYPFWSLFYWYSFLRITLFRLKK